ncbi:MAG: ATP-binding protein [Halobaculum sp.]
MARHTQLRTTDSIDTDEVILLNSQVIDESDDLALLEAPSGDARGIFRVRASRDRPLENKRWVKVHSNAQELLGGSPDSVAVSGEQKALNQLEECSEMTVVVPGGSRSMVERYFSQNRFVHPEMDEVREVNGRTVQFRVRDAYPYAPGKTYLVNDETRIEFAEPEPSAGDEGESDDTDDGSGDKPYSTSVPETELSDVVGLDEAKDHATSLVTLYNDGTYEELTDRYSEEIVSKEGSLLLYGPPGCGKTMIAEAIANEFIRELDRDVVFMQVSGSDILSKLQGESEGNVRQIFEDAIAKAGSNGFVVLFFDEVENLVQDRSADRVQSSRVSITNEFLTQMNKIEENVLVIGATNLPFKIDSAASRRFHTKLFCPHPSAAEMADKWRQSLEKVDLKADDIDYRRLGEATEGYTPAEIDNRILGSLVQTEVIDEYLNGTPRRIDESYLLEKIEETDMRTIPEYVEKIDAKLRTQQLSGYGELEQYIENNREMV